MHFEKVIDAWSEAALDLKIRIRSPFYLTTSNGDELKFSLLIEQFGNELGTIVFSIDDKTGYLRANEFGFYCSCISLDYSNYNRKIFVDTLNDWGYFGKDSDKPDWYTGQPWI